MPDLTRAEFEAAKALIKAEAMPKTDTLELPVEVVRLMCAIADAVEPPPSN